RAPYPGRRRPFPTRRSSDLAGILAQAGGAPAVLAGVAGAHREAEGAEMRAHLIERDRAPRGVEEPAAGEVPEHLTHGVDAVGTRSEEHTSELQSRFDLVCRL